jgi:hypothetical protein
VEGAAVPGIKYKHGDAILLYWDLEPEAWYVKGHVSWAMALHALYKEYGRNIDIGPIEHNYARWSMEAGIMDTLGVESVLREYPDRGRGRFPVTVVRCES